MHAAALFVTAVVSIGPLHGLAQELNAPTQQASTLSQPVAYVPLEGVKVSGALDVSNGRASIGTSGIITAGDRTANISLVRGGQLRLCATTTLHITTDRSVNQANSAAPSGATANALLMALDRGALEASYVTGKYSDVLMTPDFRILVSGPGTADLKVRVNAKGDTCIDNHGAGAPYVIVSSQFDGGAYRVQPNQRVLFEHGSLHDVVDNESEPCGCPPPQTLTTAQVALPTAPANPATGTAAGTNISPEATATTAKPPDAGTEFPLAVSEGLAPPPLKPTTPVAVPGEVHVQVTVPLAYEGTTGKSSSAAVSGTGAAAAVPPAPKAPAVAVVSPAAPVVPVTAVAAPATRVPAAATEAKPKAGVFRRIGHFFSKLFGA